MERRQQAKELSFVFEELTNLPKLEKVKAEGMPPWLIQCFEMSISGAMQPAKLQWPTVHYKHQLDDFKFTAMSPADIPALDWKAFALSNGIAFPSEMNQYFPEE